MLKLGRCNLNLEIRTLMMIDSLEMTDADRHSDSRTMPQRSRKSYRDHARNRYHGHHGSDARGELQDKTIVLTGAMVPYKFGSSDGLFNLGSALAFAQTLPPGVYVAMNGRFFPAGRVRKNPQTGMFEES